jgi:hypothetical protein
VQGRFTETSPEVTAKWYGFSTDVFSKMVDYIPSYRYVGLSDPYSVTNYSAGQAAILLSLPF